MSENAIKRDIRDDITRISDGLQNGIKIDELTKLHMYIDGKYNSKVPNWGLSQYGWDDKLGFCYDLLDLESQKHNLINMKNKLEGYLQDYGRVPKSLPFNNIHIINNNSVEINMEMNFNNLISQIENMESLTEVDTIEAISKIKELEKIYKSKESKKKRWEGIKKILIWLADKSVDLAIAYLPIITSTLDG